MNNLTPLLLLLLIVACKENPPAGHRTEKITGKADNIYKLHLDPVPGSAYHYEITNDSRTTMEAGGRNVDNRNKTSVGVSYEIGKDSAGNFVLHMNYDKIQLHTKNDDTETDLDAANAASSSDPVERLLGLLKEAQITTTINPTGEIRSVKGYQELTDKVMARLQVPEGNERQMAQSRWQQLVEEGVIKKNVEQLFHLFPDSAVTVGDTWKINSHEQSELPLNIQTTYTLQSIDDGIAIIVSKGEMTSDNTPSSVMGYEVSGNLKGQQKGRYEVETATGMLLNSNITAEIEGTLLIMGREIPITIETTVRMNGKKVK